MIKIKELYLENFCGYRKMNFKFYDKNGKINPMSIFFGPNGVGKSSVLQAIFIVCNPYFFMDKKDNLYLRKFIYHSNYEVDYQGFKEPEHEMKIEAVFETPEGDKRVVVENKGIVLCEIPRKVHGHAYFLNADHPMNMRKFQVSAKHIENFLNISEIVYGYDCRVGRKIDINDTLSEEVEFLSNLTENKNIKPDDEEFVYTDFIIHKVHRNEGEKVKVHFKSMSDGERKIATLLSSLFDPNYIEDTDIILVDNIEMHVYYKRHAAMLDKLMEYFPSKQFIFTTHSGTMIDHVEKKYSNEYLYDLEEMKDGVISKREWAY